MIGKKVTLRRLQQEDAMDLLTIARQNKTYWSTYEPVMSDTYYTLEAQLDRLDEAERLYHMGKEYHFGIFNRFTDRLIGQISLYDVKQLPYMKGTIGYSMSEEMTGKGRMTEAIQLLTRYGHRRLRLRRIEAYVSPENIGSVRVLERNGYEREGTMRDYLYINGKWEDHYLYAHTSSI